MASAQPCRAAADRIAGWAETAEHVGRAGVIDDWQGDRICVGRFVAGSVPARGHLASLALYLLLVSVKPLLLRVEVVCLEGSRACVWNREGNSQVVSWAYRSWLAYTINQRAAARGIGLAAGSGVVLLLS